MSTILKALEKVEEDERLGRTPGDAEPGAPLESAAPAEPASQEGRRLPWRGALVGAAVVTFTLGLVWLWSPEQAEKEIAQTAPGEARPALRAAAEPTETAAVSSDLDKSVPTASIGNDPGDLANSIATRLAAAVSDKPPVSNVAPPPAAELPRGRVVPPAPESPRGRVVPPAAEPPPLAGAAEIQPTAEGPTSPPASTVRSVPPSPAPSRAEPPVASLPAALPEDPPSVEPAPTPVAPRAEASVALAPPAARTEPEPRSTPPTAKPEPAPKPPPAKPRPTRVVSIPPAPTVHVTRTVWHPSPDRRSAQVEVEGFVEPLELKEGDAVGVLVVTEIQPSAVVFLHGGARLRRSVGK
ncbi:MAG: hypothetical protein GY937_06425 [bacterium]|nr:hypothetical protein [bacterium]